MTKWNHIEEQDFFICIIFLLKTVHVDDISLHSCVSVLQVKTDSPVVENYLQSAECQAVSEMGYSEEDIKFAVQVYKHRNNGT